MDDPTASGAVLPVTDKNKLDALVDAISDIDYTEFSKKSIGDDVEELSSNTIFDAIEVAPEAIFEKLDGTFEASAIVYVTLNYGGKRDGVSMPDSYPAIVRASYDNGAMNILDIKVDTGSFYE